MQEDAAAKSSSLAANSSSMNSRRYQWGPPLPSESESTVAKKSNESSRKLAGVSFGDIHINNIGQLRKLNEHAFPLTYADKFYKEIPTLSKDFTQFAYYGGFVVGAVCGRLETIDSSSKKLYIMTIGVLVAYRERGIGKMLLDYLLENAEKDPDVSFVYLHVQTSNLAALEFYRKAGFMKVGIIRNYYKRIDPPDCFVLTKLLHYGPQQNPPFDTVLPDIAAQVGVDLNDQDPKTS